MKAPDPVRPRAVLMVLDVDGGQEIPARLTYNGRAVVETWV